MWSDLRSCSRSNGDSIPTKIRGCFNGEVVLCGSGGEACTFPPVLLPVSIGFLNLTVCEGGDGRLSSWHLLGGGLQRACGSGGVCGVACSVV